MTDQTSQTTVKKPPTISMAYGPGGGALVGIPAKIYTRLQELVGEPFHVMFAAADAASGHAPLYAAFYGPKTISAKEAESQFWQGAPEFFPPVKNRIPKMLAANISHTAKKFLDPNITDIFRLRDIQGCCAQMEQISPITLAPVIERFKKLTTQQWPRKHHLERAFAIYEKFLQAPELKPFVTVVLTHANARTGQMSRLKRIFSQAVLGVGGVINQRWATNYLYDAAVQKKRYTETFGDARLADCKGTIFFPAHDIVQNVDVNFYCLKKNLLKPGSSENAEVSNNNHTLIDAVMSTSAHPMAVPPHETEDKMLCTDSSPWHAFDRNVMHVKQALAAENPYAKLDVFIFNTGNDAIESVSVAQAQERITQLGLPGGFSDGTQMAMIGGNTISGAIDYLKRQLGDNHIFHLTPRLLPRTPKEAAEFPSRNVIDTSPSNMLAIQQRAQQTLIELDEEIRKCALRIAENLWSIDYYDHAQYEKCRNRIINAPVPVTDVKPPPDAPDIFDEIRTTRGKRMSHRVSTWILHNLLPLSAANDNAGRITPPAPVKNTQDRKFGP